MAVTLNSTGITFSDGTSASTAVGYTSSIYFGSSGTWTCPAGVTRVTIELIGGGGGGGHGTGAYSGYNASGRGGAGGHLVCAVGVVPGTVYTVTIGAGGNGGTALGGGGASGGESWFGVNSSTKLASAGGGGGGSGSTTTAGAVGTTSYTGDGMWAPAATGYRAVSLGFNGTAISRGPGNGASGAFSWSYNGGYFPGTYGTNDAGIYASGCGGGGGAAFLTWIQP